MSPGSEVNLFCNAESGYRKYENSIFEILNSNLENLMERAIKSYAMTYLLENSGGYLTGITQQDRA
jgi:hypothetical protein